MNQPTLPGPRGGLKIGAGGRLAAYIEAHRVHGEIVCVNDNPAGRTFLVSHPDHVKHVLQDHQANYRQNFRKKVLMGQQSLTLASGDAWKQRRRLLQPLFNQQRLAPLAPKVTAGTARMVEGWAEAARRGEAVDLSHHFAELTLDLLIGDLLGDAGAHGTLRQSVTTAFDYFNERARNPDKLPLWVPTPRNLGMANALRGLARDVRRTIAGRRENAEPASDLLSMMLAARDEQSGQAMNPEQIQDEIMMLLVMGHMTTAMALAWIFYLLGRHPDAEARVRAEVADVVGDRPAGYPDVAKLTYTRMVIEETLRLYPPTWTFTRFTLQDDVIGGYRIPAGSVVTLAPWVTHRRPELWPDPERFDPSRFEAGRAAERPRFAYYPFGGGPRVCIARDMAMLELPLVLATVLQRYRLRPLPGPSAAPIAGIVLRPRAGLWMKLEDAAAPAAAETAFEPVPALLLRQAADVPAVLRRDEGGRYEPVPRAEFLDRARRAARGLAGLGVAPGDRFAVLAAGPEALLVDLAALVAGAVTVPLQPTPETAETVRALRESGARYVAAAPARLTELLARRQELPAVQGWIQLGAGAASAEGVTTLPSLLEAGGKGGPELEALVRRIRPEDPASLLFTPGTTGAPRAVEITHGNLAAAVRGAGEALPLRSGEVVFSGLPFARPSERTFLYASLRQGATLAFPGSADSLDKDLMQARPHVFTSTPEFWKRYLNWLFQAVQANGPRRRRLFQDAIALGRQVLPFRLQGKTPPTPFRWRLFLAEKLVYSRIRAPLGGRFRFAVSGGDRIPHGWISMLWGAGIPVYESYGLTETCGFATLNSPAAVQPATVGAPVPGMELRVSGDGEILLRGPAVAAGPAVDSEGWLHTGDHGWIDEAAMLNIMGRQSEMYTNGDGKKVSPGGLESLLRSSHFIAQAVVVGEGRPHNAVLIAPDSHLLQRVAKRRNIAFGSLDELVRDPAIRELIAKEIEGFNAKLAAHDQIKAWEILPHPFSVANGELTPTRTLRRKAVMEKYAGAIEKMYGA